MAKKPQGKQIVVEVGVIGGKTKRLLLNPEDQMTVDEAIKEAEFTVGAGYEVRVNGRKAGLDKVLKASALVAIVSEVNGG